MLLRAWIDGLFTLLLVVCVYWAGFAKYSDQTLVAVSAGIIWAICAFFAEIFVERIVWEITSRIPGHHVFQTWPFGVIRWMSSPLIALALIYIFQNHLI